MEVKCGSRECWGPGHHALTVTCCNIYNLAQDSFAVFMPPSKQGNSTSDSSKIHQQTIQYSTRSLDQLGRGAVDAFPNQCKNCRDLAERKPVKEVPEHLRVPTGSDYSKCKDVVNFGAPWEQFDPFFRFATCISFADSTVGNVRSHQFQEKNKYAGPIFFKVASAWISVLRLVTIHDTCATGKGSTPCPNYNLV